MKILFLTNYYPPSHKGGYEELCAEVAQGLTNRGHNTYIITSRQGNLSELTSQPNIYRILDSEIPYYVFSPSFDFFVRRIKRLHKNLFLFQDYIDRIEPEIIFVWGMWNLPKQLLTLAESIRTTKIAYYIADYWPSLPDAYTLHWKESADHPYAAWLKYILGKVALKRLAKDLIVQPKYENAYCVSQAVRTQLITGGYLPVSAQVVYNGIDLDDFQFAMPSKENFTPSHPMRLLYAGRISPEKGIETALYAFAELIQKRLNLKLTIIGRGKSLYTKEIRKLAQTLSILEHIQFLPHVPRGQMSQIYGEHEALLVPSTWQEPMPRVIQEAMAVGLATIASSVGGIPEIIQHNINGLLFSPGNHTELAEKIFSLYANPSTLTELINNARQTIEQRFNLEIMINKLDNRLSGLLQNY